MVVPLCRGGTSAGADPEGNAFLWRRSGDSQDPSPLGDVGKSRSVLLPRSRCSISMHACRAECGACADRTVGGNLQLNLKITV